jgi:hypothetical protein
MSNGVLYLIFALNKVKFRRNIYDTRQIWKRRFHTSKSATRDRIRRQEERDEEKSCLNHVRNTVFCFCLSGRIC